MEKMKIVRNILIFAFCLEAERGSRSPLAAPAFLTQLVRFPMKRASVRGDTYMTERFSRPAGIFM